MHGIVAGGAAGGGRVELRSVAWAKRASSACSGGCSGQRGSCYHGPAESEVSYAVLKRGRRDYCKVPVAHGDGCAAECGFEDSAA